jgi:hypothetical protein
MSVVPPKAEANLARRANHFGFSEMMSSPGIKNISLWPQAKSVVQSCPSTATRGAIAIVTTVRWDAVDAKAATDERGPSVR